jgi:hypothetical protein
MHCAGALLDTRSLTLKIFVPYFTDLCANMKSGLRRQLLITYENIFPGPSEELSSILKGLGRSKFLRDMAFFLRLKPAGGKFSNYRSLLQMFFSPENDSFANEVRGKLDALAQTESTDIIIIHPIACLQLFEYAFDFLENNPTQTELETEISIFKAILLINQHNTALQSKGSSNIKDLGDDLRLAAMSLSSTFPYSEFMNFDKSELHVGQLIKSIFLFEFLEGNEKTRPLLDGFVKYYDCGEWKNFLRNLMPLTTQIIASDEEKYIDINFSKGDKAAVIGAFMNKLIVHDTTALKDYDFKKMRAAPFYQVGELTYRIIFGLFVLELFHKGVYFKLNEINSNLPAAERITDFRSFYCDEFSEKTLLYKLMKSIYQERCIQYSGEQIKQMGFDAEPDYYLIRQFV